MKTLKYTENKDKFIGSQIKKAREEAGYPQLDLAKALGFDSATAISLIESGERKISAENLEKVADFLHRGVSYFLGREEKVIKLGLTYALRAANDISAADKKTIEKVIDLARQKRKHDGRKS